MNEKLFSVITLKKEYADKVSYLLVERFQEKVVHFPLSPLTVTLKMGAEFRDAESMNAVRMFAEGCLTAIKREG